MGGSETWIPVIEELNAKEDGELVAAVLAGQRDAFSLLVRKHQRGLLRLAIKFTRDLAAAEDVAQEAFLKAFERLRSLEGQCSFRSWLYQIAVNTAKNKLRGRREGQVDCEKVILAVAPTAEISLRREVIARELRAEVDRLPFRQRTALVLRVYENLSFKEIAEIMECPYDTAKANFRHALMKLKDVVGDRGDLRTVSWGTDELIQNQVMVEVDA
ncbi:MAG: RNA polymerase subunit sigma [Bdellovibrio sp.]|nr:MAG: RNA polymerase subunit sigma [Bdellovibrio sp.]